MRVATRILAPAATILLLTGCANLAERERAMTAAERCQQMARAEAGLWLPSGSHISCSKNQASLHDLAFWSDRHVAESDYGPNQ
jgi:hypothetical protein